MPVGERGLRNPQIQNQVEVSGTFGALKFLHTTVIIIIIVVIVILSLLQYIIVMIITLYVNITL